MCLAPDRRLGKAGFVGVSVFSLSVPLHFLICLPLSPSSFSLSILPLFITPLPPPHFCFHNDTLSTLGLSLGLSWGFRAEVDMRGSSG